MLKIGAGNVGFLVLCSNDEVRCTDCHKICKIHGCLITQENSFANVFLRSEVWPINKILNSHNMSSCKRKGIQTIPVLFAKRNFLSK
jgi:hypothetical protein